MPWPCLLALALAADAPNLLANADFAANTGAWWFSDGLQAEIVPCELAGWPKALRLTVHSAPGAEAWTVQGAHPLQGAVKVGDRLVVRVWLRSPERCAFQIQTQLNREPWSGLASMTANATPVWREHLLQAVAVAGAEAGSVSLNVQLGGAQGVLEVAGMRVENLGDAPAVAVRRPGTDDSLVPFVLPWDDHSPSVANVSDWLPKPAGGQGFVQVRDGHFYTGDQRLRFLGTNLTASDCFVEPAVAAKVAGRLAKFGINCVRFHHMDAGWGRTLLQGDRRTIDPEQLKKLDAYLAALKAEGIYANLNLHCSRVYPGFETWPGMPEFMKGVDLFYPPMIELQKEFARDLLTHRSTVTGLAMVDEPAVAMVEINNENGLLSQWNWTSLDRLPAIYRDELSRQWNAWLGKRYTNDAAMKAAWGVVDQPLGTELLGDGAERWYLELNGTAHGQAAPGPEGGLRVTIDAVGAEAWHAQFMQTGLALQAAQPYSLAFRARSSTPRSISLDLRLAHEPWSTLWQTRLELGTAWREYSFIAMPAAGDTNARVTFSDLGRELGWLDLADVSLRPGGTMKLRDGDALGTSPMILKAEVSSLPPAMQRDWTHFLWDTERAYWTMMRDFLRDELGVKCPIAGTAAGFSPAPLQGELDFVDAHAYWNHPRFPGAAWDPNSWEVANNPMTDAAEGGNVWPLASRRVAGKPFTVTEYNHPAPQTRNSEAFLLLAAYAALQDWDGIFSFAYGGAHEKIEGWFNVGSHPNQMATMPVAAAMFLRGDVATAKMVIRGASTSEQAIAAAHHGGSWISAGSFGVASAAVLKHRIAWDLGPAGPVSQPNSPDEGRSDTGELSWQRVDGRGVVTINAPRTRALIGATAEPVTLGDVTITPGRNMQDWAAITVTAMDGDTVAAAKRLLLTATGWAENSDMGWTDDRFVSVGTNWGRGPSLVEVVPATITLPYAPGRVTVRALDERGQPAGEVSVTPQEGRAVVALGGAARTIWYEVTVR